MNSLTFKSFFAFNSIVDLQPHNTMAIWHWQVSFNSIVDLLFFCGCGVSGVLLTFQFYSRSSLDRSRRGRRKYYSFQFYSRSSYDQDKRESWARNNFQFYSRSSASSHKNHFFPSQQSFNSIVDLLRSREAVPIPSISAISTFNSIVDLHLYNFQNIETASLVTFFQFYSRSSKER